MLESRSRIVDNQSGQESALSVNELDAEQRERRRELAEALAPERRLLAFTAMNRANHSYSLLIRIPAIGGSAEKK